MSLRAYHLHFDSPLHVGVEGIGQERIEDTVRSDTLWGALVQQWSLLFDESPADLARDCPFLVSSCFPLVRDRRFYPLPEAALEALGAELSASGEAQKELRFKDIKKIRYLGEPLLQRLLEGELLQLADLADEGSHLPRVDDKGKPHSLDVQRPRQRIDRLTGSVEQGGFFYCTDKYFASENGLFFLMACEDDTVRRRFEAALLLLGDSGLGADRSIGRGRFRMSIHTPALALPENAGQHLLLSLCHPTREEVLAGRLKDALYRLERRSGHAGAPGVGSLRRTDLWVLAEGAVLPAPLQGDIPEVIAAGGPAPHPVYRYGRALTLPMAQRRAACP